MGGCCWTAATRTRASTYTRSFTPASIVSVFQKYGVPREPDYVSIDIDSYDLQVLLALTEVYRPRVLTVEYNAQWSLEESKMIPEGVYDQSELPRTGYMGGAFLAAIHKAAKLRNYSIVHVVFPVD